MFCFVDLFVPSLGNFASLRGRLPSYPLPPTPFDACYAGYNFAGIILPLLITCTLHYSVRLVGACCC